jgi:predicted nucleic acid-binding protein
VKGVLVDSDVLLDIFLDNPGWAEWSLGILSDYASRTTLYINPVVYAELSMGFERIEDLERTLTRGGLQMLDIPREALFLAGKAFLSYRRKKGPKRSPLPDFFIGAHAAILEIPLITRSVANYRSFLPTVRLISPENS